MRSSNEKPPVTIDMDKNPDGTYELRDSKGNFEALIERADLNQDSPYFIETIINQIKEAYTSKTSSPAIMSDYGKRLKTTAIEKMQDLIIAGARHIESVDELSQYFWGDNEDDLVPRLLRWYRNSVPDRRLQELKDAEYKRCFSREIERVETKDEAWNLSQKINQWYNRAGLISPTSGELNALLSEKFKTLPPEPEA